MGNAARPTRRQLLQGLAAAAGVAAVAGVTPWQAQSSARAAGLILPPGTRPDPSKPEGVDTMPQVEHVIIYMQENHSYDNYFGMLPRGDGFTRGGDGKPTNSNPNANGDPITAFHQASTCDVITGDHGWNGTHRAWHGGAMDGFVQASGDHVMGYYDDSNLPFYWDLAMTFPICDRWFSSMLGPTHPNRRFLQAGTSAGMVTTDMNEVLAHPSAPNGTIWDRLDAHGITWKDYAIDLWDILLYPGSDLKGFLKETEDNRRYFKDFLSDCLHGTLPQVSILAPGTKDQYDEGSQDSQNGEAYSFSIINAVLFSPLWDKTVVLFTYDEHGGGYDHVPPPAAVLPDDIEPRITVPPWEPGRFDRYGIRVPGFVISPHARRDYVSHVVHDHTSILKFIETKWNLGALTYRDANADDLLDCFDFSKKAFGDPPMLAEPGLPEGGSACQPQPRPPVNPRVVPSTTTTTAPTTTAPSTTTTAPATASPAGAVAGSPAYTG